MIVYANDAVDPAKQKRALEVVASLMRSGEGLIPAAAVAARCDVLLSEDFATRRRYAGVEVRDPLAG